jgi:hypothetical protein
MSERDEFKQTIKRVMAERVAWRCSFPNCGKVTIGPKMGGGEGEKSLNLGEAAHIVAAALGGPRPDPNTTSEFRRSIENGIWMCRAHARLIDSDDKEYSVETLKLWKAQAEEQAYRNLKLQDNYVVTDRSTLISIGFDILLRGVWISVEQNKWTFEVKKIISGDSQDLKKYADSFEEVDYNQKYISVESQGDARFINQPINIYYQSDGSEHIMVTIESKIVASLPSNVGMDFMLGENRDLITENGDLRMVSGVDSAIQQLGLSAGMIYGEWYLDKTAGSFVSDYYERYKSDISLLTDLIKLEIIRLSLVPRRKSNNQLVDPPLNFIKEVKSVVILSIELRDSNLDLELTLVLGDGTLWKGLVPVFVKEDL